MLGNVVYFVVGCLTTYGFLSIYKKSIQNKEKISFINYILIINMALISLLLSIINMPDFKTALTIINFILLFYYNRNKNMTLSHVTLLTILIWFLCVLVDILVMVFVSLINNLTIMWSLNPIIFQGLSGIIVFIFLILISKSKLPILLNKFIQKYLSKTFVNIILVILLFLSTIIFGIYCFTKLEEISYRSLFILLIIANNISIVCLIVLNNYKKYLYENTIENLISNNSYYLERMDELSIMKHNLKHNLLGLKYCVNENAQKMIDEIFDEYNVAESLKEDKLPFGINGLIYEKIYNKEFKNVKVNIRNYFETEFFKNISLKKYNKVCSLLCIALDNALESAQKSKDGVVSIELLETTDIYKIIISNNFNNCLDLSKFGTKNYTTKSSGHGIGIYSILDKNILGITTTIVNNIFIVKIEIKKDA